MNLRPAEPSDHQAIRRILLAAFPDSSEADLVEQLRDAGHTAIELVAEDRTDLLGHILFSPMDAPIRALALGPVAVSPEHQNQGIGGALIRRGQRIAGEAGWQAIFLVGEPEYYSRFGYSADAARSFDCLYAGPYFMMLPLTDPLPALGGEVRYAPPFSDLGQPSTA